MNVRSTKPDEQCMSCFQAHAPVTKRVYICTVTGADIPHPNETGGRCEKCSRSHEDVRSGPRFDKGMGHVSLVSGEHGERTQSLRFGRQQQDQRI